MLETIVKFLGDYGGHLGGAAGAVGLIEYLFSPIRRLFRKPETVELGEASRKAITNPDPEAGRKMHVADFIHIRRELKEDLEAELATAHDEEKTQLRARIAELENQLTNPEAAFKEMQAKIADLETQLARAGNDISAERLAEARTALEKGDFSKADALFAEIEAREEIAIQNAARAAFGRGEIAEAEIRWHEAYEHYRRAAHWTQSTEHLQAYVHMAWLLAKNTEAEEVCRSLVERAGEKFGLQSAEYATELNNYAAVLKGLGRSKDAELHYRQALRIGRKTIGEVHPDYASRLSNLAGVVRDQGKLVEAERLYRKVVQIDQKTIGNRHPYHATTLSNLAEVLMAREKFSESEKLLCNALEIDKSTIGEAHPDYATRLQNLGVLKSCLGDVEAARNLFLTAKQIFVSTLPPDHPDILAVSHHLASLPN